MLIPKKALKTRRRELSIADGVLDRLVAQIALDGSGIQELADQAKELGIEIDLN